MVLDRSKLPPCASAVGRKKIKMAVELWLFNICLRMSVGASGRVESDRHSPELEDQIPPQSLEVPDHIPSPEQLVEKGQYLVDCPSWLAFIGEDKRLQYSNHFISRNDKIWGKSSFSSTLAQMHFFLNSFLSAYKRLMSRLLAITFLFGISFLSLSCWSTFSSSFQSPPFVCS